MAKKLTIEQVRRVYDDRGWVLNSEKYIGAHYKLDCTCPNGHKRSMTYATFKQSAGKCKDCVSEKLSFGIERVRLEFEKRKCILKSTKYINNDTELEYICPYGHTHVTTWRRFRNTSVCPIEGKKKQTDKLRFDIEIIRKNFKERGWEITSTKYINTQTKIDFICDKGHSGSMTYANFSAGRGCLECEIERRRIKIEYIREQFIKNEWVLRSTVYTNNNTNLEYECKYGHIHNIKWKSFQQGHTNCPTCYFLETRGEKHHCWNGGRKRKQYCDAWYDKEYKLDLRGRDGFKCQNPHCSCDMSAIDDLCLHHIDYNTMNCKPSNLIILCRKCHSMSNFDREWHTLYFQTLMNKKFGYMY